MLPIIVTALEVVTGGLWVKCDPIIKHKKNLPIIVIAPFSVACTTASMTAFVPLEKFSNSNTPGGL